MKWRRSQHNDTRKKIFAVHLHCLRVAQAFKDISSGYRVKHSFSVAFCFSRCASMAASPTIGDVKALNKLARQAQVTASESSVLATHRSVENHWISWCLLPKYRRWIFTERDDSVFLQSRVSDRQKMECRMEVLLTMKAKRLKKLCPPLLWLSWIPSWSVLAHAIFSGGNIQWSVQKSNMRTDARNTWSVQQEQITYLNKKGDNSHDLHVEERSLFRKYSWPCSYSNSELSCRLSNKSISQKADNLITALKTGRLQDVDIHPNFRTPTEHKAFLSTWCRTFMHTTDKGLFFLNTLRCLSHQLHKKGRFHVMFVRKQHTQELKEPKDCDWNHFSLTDAVPPKLASKPGRGLVLIQLDFAAVKPA